MLAHVQRDRQGIERGEQIRVGGSWWNAGGEKLIQYLHMTDDEIRKIVEEYGEDYRPVLGDGDINGLDMGIKRFFMELYATTSGRYYKFRNINDKRTFRIMRLHCLEAISARITHLFGDEWRIFLGGMPSGSFETSHGDSWIMLLMYNIFVQFVWERNPSLRKLIDFCCQKGWQNIVLYGDDHIIRTIKKLQAFLGEQAFVNFLFEFFDLTSRDVRDDVPMLSIPSPDGGVLVKGIVFLKKYLIRTPPHMYRTNVDMPDYVPYRTIDAYYHRIAFGSSQDRTIIDQIMSCIGNAYDTMGTNLRAFEFLKHIYVQLMHSVGVDEQVVKMMIHERMMQANVLNDFKDITKLMRKCNITLEELLRGFPTIDDLVVRNARNFFPTGFKKNF